MAVAGGAGEWGENAGFGGLEGVVEGGDECRVVDGGAKGEEKADEGVVACAGGGVEFGGEGVWFLYAKRRMWWCRESVVQRSASRVHTGRVGWRTGRRGLDELRVRRMRGRPLGDCFGKSGCVRRR